LAGEPLTGDLEGLARVDERDHRHERG
jgi:hypothetical protein